MSHVLISSSKAKTRSTTFTCFVKRHRLEAGVRREKAIETAIENIFLCFQVNIVLFDAMCCHWSIAPRRSVLCSKNLKEVKVVGRWTVRHSRKCQIPAMDSKFKKFYWLGVRSGDRSFGYCSLNRTRFSNGITCSDFFIWKNMTSAFTTFILILLIVGSETTCSEILLKNTLKNYLIGSF